MSTTSMVTAQAMQALQFGPRSWHGEGLDPACGHVHLPPDVIAELDHCIGYVRRNPLPVLALRCEDFELSTTERFATQLREELDRGCGFVLIDRLPMASWSREECVAAYWLLASCIARPVAQSHDGKMVYDVRDRGKPPGNGVRPDVTNVGQNFHTDNSYNHVPPHYVGLLCLQPSVSGGTSGIVNFGWALDAMRERYPDLVERLFEPFYFDRQREHAEGDVMVCRHPLFERDGDGNGDSDGNRLIARLSHRQVVNGYALAGKPFDDRGRAALDALESILNEPGAAKTFMFEAGQIQIINNRALGHCRAAFQDSEDLARRRHLIRLWLRDSGARGYGV